MRELMVLLFLMAVVLFVVSLIDRDAYPTVSEFNVICLDGVEYWYRQIGYKGMMAVKLNTDGNITACVVD